MATKSRFHGSMAHMAKMQPWQQPPLPEPDPPHFVLDDFVTGVSPILATATPTAPKFGRANQKFSGSTPHYQPMNVPSWCTVELCGVASQKMPPFLTPGPGEHGFFKIRPGEMPAMLANYYVGDAGRWHDLIAYNSHDSHGRPMLTSAGVGSGWAIGEFVVIPNTWSPYAKPIPTAGGMMPAWPYAYPPLPSIPPIPGVDALPSGYPYHPPGF